MPLKLFPVPVRSLSISPLENLKTFFNNIKKIQSESLGNLQKVLLRIVMILSGLSLSACGIVLAYLLARKEPLREVLSFVVVLLVASIPIAIEIVSTTTLALGSRSLSKQGAIVSKLTAIEEMAGMNMLCSDKTGTLTLNKMVIQGKSFFLFLQVVPFFRERRNVGFFLSHFFLFLVELKKKNSSSSSSSKKDDCPTWMEGYDMKKTLQAAAMAAKWWEPPRDALDTMTLGAADLESLKPYKHLDFMPFDPQVKRTEATIEGPEGKFKVTKGATHIILDLCVDKDAIHGEVDAKVSFFFSFEFFSLLLLLPPALSSLALTRLSLGTRSTPQVTEYGLRGIRCMAVARTDAAAELPAKDVWRFIGVLTFLDPPRFDTKQTIEEAMEMGVDVKMITGDNVLIAREVRREREKREERVFFFPSFSSFPFFSICSLARLRSSLRLHSLFSPPPLLVLSTPQNKPNQNNKRPPASSAWAPTSRRPRACRPWAPTARSPRTSPRRTAR